MFRRLREASPRWVVVTTVEGYVVSMAAHALLVATVIAAGAPAPRSEEIPESLTWARFLLPPDKPTGSRVVRERVAYLSVANPGGRGQLASDTREPERLEIVKPEGTAKDDLTEVATPLPPAPELPGDTVLTVLEVDSAAARYDESAAPPYPPNMLRRRLGGTVAVQYVVDTTGLADTSSFVVLSTTHADFARSVQSTLPLMRFHPATMNSRKVRQLVQQLFTFRIDSADVAPPRKPTGTG